MIPCRSWSSGNRASLFAILTSVRVPSFLCLSTLSADRLARYVSANVKSVATSSRAHPVSLRMRASSWGLIG